MEEGRIGEGRKGGEQRKLCNEIKTITKDYLESLTLYIFYVQKTIQRLQVSTHYSFKSQRNPQKKRGIERV